MLLDLSNAHSIVAWWQVWPERHDSYLDYKLQASPEFAPVILAARRLIQASPALRALLATSLQKRQAPQDWQVGREDEMSAPEPVPCEIALH